MPAICWRWLEGEPLSIPRLMARSANFLGSRGLVRMTVWTLTINPARAFYEKRGGTYREERSVEIGGQTLHEVCYGYEVVALCLAMG